jgi:hypothetical protein
LVFVDYHTKEELEKNWQLLILKLTQESSIEVEKLNAMSAYLSAKAKTYPTEFADKAISIISTF